MGVSVFRLATKSQVGILCCLFLCIGLDLYLFAAQRSSSSFPGRYAKFFTANYFLSVYYAKASAVFPALFAVDLSQSTLGAVSKAALGLVFKLPLIRPLEYYNSIELYKTYPPSDNLFDVFYFTKYFCVLGLFYSVKLSLDWHQRSALVNTLGTREPLDTLPTPVQVLITRRNKKLNELRASGKLTVEEESQLLYMQRVKDLEWYLGVDTPPQTPGDPNSNNGTLNKTGASTTAGETSEEGKTNGAAKAANGETPAASSSAPVQAAGTIQLVKVKNVKGLDVEVVQKPPNERAPAWSLFGSIPDELVYRIPDSRFKLRNIGYLSSKQKVPAKPGMYDVMGADIVRGKNGKVQHIVHNFMLDFPKWPGDIQWDKAWGVPEILLMVCEIPIETGSMFSGIPESDHGFTFLTYFMLNEESRRVLKSGQLSPHLKLWQNTVKVGRSFRKGHSFKFLAQCENINDKKFSSGSIGYLKGYNGKPVLLCDTCRFLHDKMPQILEIDFDIREWNFLVRKNMPTVRDLMKDAHAELCYLVEGKNDGELPEVPLATGRMDYIEPFKQPEVDMKTDKRLLPEDVRAANRKIIEASLDKKNKETDRCLVGRK